MDPLVIPAVLLTLAVVICIQVTLSQSPSVVPRWLTVLIIFVLSVIGVISILVVIGLLLSGI